MNLVIIPAGKLGQLCMFTTLLAMLLLILWSLELGGSQERTKSVTPDASDANRYRLNQHFVDMSKWPRLSADKKTLVVTNEDALPTAFEFLRLNMYLPIEKIVLVKPGVNNTVRVYPIPREGMIGLGRNNLPLSLSEIGLIFLFLIFIIGSFAYILTSISSTRLYWDEEGWLHNDDLCFDAADVAWDDDMEEKKILVKAEKKRKEIEGKELIREDDSLSSALLLQPKTTTLDDNNPKV